MPRVQHKDTVLAALTAAQKPMTASQIDGAVGIGVSEVRKAMRKLAAAEVVHLYAWSRRTPPVHGHLCGPAEKASTPHSRRVRSPLQ